MTKHNNRDDEATKNVTSDNEGGSATKVGLQEENEHTGAHHRTEEKRAGEHRQKHDTEKGSHGEHRAKGEGHGHGKGHGNCTRLTFELEEEKKKSAEYLDLAQRKQAEFENFKKRTEAERLRSGEFATGLIIQKLLEPLDDLDRAIEASKVGGDYDSLLKGVEIIRERLMEVFRSMGLEEISPENEKFDPNLHEAVMALESDEHEEDQVREVFQKGYRFKERVLRPAKVQVSKKP